MAFTRDFLLLFFILLGRLSPVWLTLAAIISSLGLLLAHVEQLAHGDGLYVAWITATTVGYGDITPSHGLSKIICVIMAMIGVIFTSLIASLALNAGRVAMERHLGERLQQELQQRLDQSKRQRR